MTETERGSAVVPQTAELSPDSTAKEHNAKTTSEHQNESTSVEPVSNLYSANSSVAELLTSEVCKIAAALYLLKQPQVGDRLSLQELLSALQQKKESTSATSMLAQSVATASPSKKLPSNFPISVPLPPSSSQGPFIRILTQGRTRLLHMGQLVGILDDHSAFLLQRVVSYDPNRVKLQTLADLKPSEILDLTNSKVEKRVNEEKQSRSRHLLSQLITTTKGLEQEKRVIDSPVRLEDLTTSHGPVLITPGLVLIRADQVRELKIISENASTESVLQDYELYKTNVAGKQNQRQYWFKQPGSQTPQCSPQSTDSGHTMEEDPGTPIEKPRRAQATSSAIKNRQQTSEMDNTVTSEQHSGELEGASDEANKAKQPGRRRRAYRQRGRRKRIESSGNDQKPKSRSVSQQTARNPPNAASAKQQTNNSATTCNNTGAPFHDSAIVRIDNCQANDTSRCNCQVRRGPPANCACSRSRGCGGYYRRCQGHHCCH